MEKSFVYVPPARRATILVLERSPEGLSRPPTILDPVFNALKGTAFDLSHFDGSFAAEMKKRWPGREEFLKAVRNERLEAAREEFEKIIRRAEKE